MSILCFVIFLFFPNFVFADQMCCVYLEENNTGGDTCYSFDTDAEVATINPDAGESCPVNTYSGRLLGAYGFGPVQLGFVPEPTSAVYEQSQISKNCLLLDTFDLNGVTMSLEVKKEVPGSPLCQKGLQAVSTPNGTILRRALVKAQLADLLQTLTKFTQDNSLCCVPRIPNASTSCVQRGVNQTSWNELYNMVYGGPNPTNIFYFPPDDGEFYSCDPNATKTDWLAFDSVDVSSPFPVFAPPYVLYPESCNTQTGANYIPPWGYGNSSQVPQQLQAMCTLSGDKYCACSGDNSACSPTFYKTKEDCEILLPITVPGVNDILTQCLKLDESGGAQISCGSLVKQTSTPTTPPTQPTTKPPTVDLKSTFPSLTGLNPLKEVSIPILFGRAITIVLRVLGSLALIIFMYGGILWMTAAGNDEHVKKALSTIVWGAMGIFVIFASYAMVQFILDSFL